MKNVNLRKNSWHYRLANLFFESDFKYGDTIDMCSYLRKVLASMIMCIVVLVIVLVAGICATYLGLTAWFLVAWGTFILEPPAILAFVCLMYFLFFKAHSKYQDIKYERRLAAARSDSPPVERPDSFIKTAYLGWKEKYCSQVNFVE